MSFLIIQQGTTLVLALVRLESSRKLALGLMQQLILVSLKEEVSIDKVFIFEEVQ